MLAAASSLRGHGKKPLTLTQTRCWQHPQFYSKWKGGKQPTTWAAFTMKLYVYNNVLLLGHRGAVSQGEGKRKQLRRVRTGLGTGEKPEVLTGGKKTLFINIVSLESFYIRAYFVCYTLFPSCINFRSNLRWCGVELIKSKWTRQEGYIMYLFWDSNESKTLQRRARCPEVERIQ